MGLDLCLCRATAQFAHLRDTLKIIRLLPRVPLLVKELDLQQLIVHQEPLP